MANQNQVKAKKHLGQHFLRDENIAKKIADSLTLKGYKDVLEIGPGMGVLTKYLLKKDITTRVIEIDKESVEYLKNHYLNLADRIYERDFLKYDLNEIVSGDSIFCATGITSGDLVKGIKLDENSFISETLITHKSSNLKKIFKSKHTI